MAIIFLVIAAILAGASFASLSAAANVADAAAPNWAFRVCTQSSFICKYPQQMAYAATALAILALVLTLISFLRSKSLGSAMVRPNRIKNRLLGDE
jgi:hypothetical protein